MRIDKILFVSDDNANYLSFWNSISKFYKTVYSIQPHLFFLGIKDESNEKHLSTEYGDITYINPIKNIPIIIQALWGKFWFTQTELDTIWLIGDIDLYLLNKNYLDNCLSSTHDDQYVHLNANGYHQGNWWTAKNGLPGYFHLAKGKKFKEYLKLSDSFELDCSYIYNSKKYGILYNGMIKDATDAPPRVKDKTNFGFICCEENLSTERLIVRKDDICSFTYPKDLIRLETPFAKAGLTTPCDYNLLTNYNEKINYIDLHAPRPYNCFAKSIDTIIYKQHLRETI